MNKKLAYAVALLAFVGGAWLTPQPASAQLLGSLVVKITNPSSGDTVFGTVTVSASTSADVAGVQFRYDGIDFAAEDITAPYTATAYTNSVPNGPYTFTLVARDAAGNQTTSAPFTRPRNGNQASTTRFSHPGKRNARRAYGPTDHGLVL